MEKFEEKYQDVLHNIETALVQVYREQDEMTDWDALTAVNGLILTYTAEQRGRKAPDLKLDELAQEAYMASGLCANGGWAGRIWETSPVELSIWGWNPKPFPRSLPDVNDLLERLTS